MGNKRFLVIGLLMGILLTSTARMFYEDFIEQKSDSAAIIAPSSKQANKKIAEIEGFINRRFLHDIDANNLTESMYAGLVDGLEDDYSHYFTKEEFERAMEGLSGHYQGIGIILVIGKDSTDVVVGHVYEGAPAKEAGIEIGDIITKVDGQEVLGMLLEDISKKIREGESETVELTINREGEEQPLEITVTKGDIDVPSVASKMLADKVGYITIFQFTQGTASQFEAEYESLKSEGMERLIVDLRDNPGGSLSGVCDTLSVFMPKGLLVYSEDRQGEQVKFDSEGNNPIDIPLVVLINGNSASASEIFAGAVKDHQVGTLVGTTTFGKGVVQSIFNLADGSAIKLTTSQYFTPNGVDINGKGIAPDVEVEVAPATEDTKLDEPQDVQLEKAIEILIKK